MTDDTTLTETERAELAPFQWAFHLGVAEGRSYEAANALTAAVESIVAARVAEARAEAAAVVEGFRHQNPMNGEPAPRPRSRLDPSSPTTEEQRRCRP